MSGGESDRQLAGWLIEAFVRLAKADFSVRLPRDYTRDTEDTLAFFVNLIAEELARLLEERERDHQRLQQGVQALSESFLRLAAGDFEARAARSLEGDPLDVLAYLFNNTAAEVGDAFAELVRQRSVLAAILDSMIDGVLVLDASGGILRANLAIARLLGWPHGELVGRSLSSLLAARESPLAVDPTGTLDDDRFRDRRVAFVTSSGDVLTLTVNASAQRDGSGALAGIVLVARDDRELQQAQAQLQLGDRLTTMGLVAAGVAHEINNPMAYVMGNLDYVAEELEGARDAARERGEGAVTLAPEVVGELLQALRASLGGADRVRQIVRDLKAFARADEAPATNVELPKIIDSALSMIRNEVRHHARVVKEYGATPLVVASEARLAQVFLNLVQNAAHAIPLGAADRHEIRIVTGTDASGDAFVEVHDTGQGIAEEHLGRVFEPFFTTKSSGVGTGLGLSICRNIVAQLGGAIGVTSRVGEGTTFRVTLPAARPSQLGRSRPVVAMPPRAPRRRVLVVDDEPEIGETVRRMLGRDHDVDVVTSGALALSRLDERAYDLVLCDVMMPEMTGMELHERLSRARPEVARRIVFMSGGAFSPGGRDFLARVGNRSIEKPFEARVLRELVATLEPSS
ncbi:hybrid sensor histidine kinase/response regulator [Sandaracinus amylolyticus]|uniref:histidine kinase n=1 Tax=Sandaracinus amylolyticus TaxID=927083 RepID=A0A0F6YGN2_9BACT|nr:ATP-binding protein [Sandaracinus amylolyticus]AKF04138.1 Sensory box histidine kinase/response regulator [Sandaracinus amylolyticus]